LLEDSKGNPSRTVGGWGSCNVQTPKRSEALEFGRKIAVDFQTDADLNERRGTPGHFRLLAFCAAKLTPFTFE
jgi:hypothetical protein